MHGAAAALMGANFYWLPVKNGRSLRVDSRSHVAEVLGRLFGAEPWTLKNGEWLTALAAAEPLEDAWKHLMDILQDDAGAIRVWREW